MVEISSWVKNIVIYFEMLNNINLKMFKLCSLNSWNDTTKMKKYYLDISQELFQLLPCQLKLSSRKVIVVENDGIFTIEEGVNELKEKIKNFIVLNNDILFIIKYIRNKAEHEPHKLNAQYFFSGNDGNKIIFSYEQEKLKVSFDELKKIVVTLNKLFMDVQKKLLEYCSKLSDDYKSHPYWNYICNMKFTVYNKILLSDYLYDISFVINQY